MSGVSEGVSVDSAAEGVVSGFGAVGGLPLGGMFVVFPSDTTVMFIFGGPSVGYPMANGGGVLKLDTDIIGGFWGGGIGGF